MWKCPICDTNNEHEQPCCVVCGTLQSESFRPQETHETSAASKQGAAQSEQKQHTNQNARQTVEQENPERVIDPAGAPGIDLRYNLTISLEEAVFGAEKQIEFIREVACTVCGGSGASGAGITECPTCKGTGQDRASRRFFSKEPSKPTALCKTCHGSGRVPVAKCSACRGLGRCSAHESKKILVPPGINTGQSILVKGMGNVSYNSGANGDLYVSFRVSPHDKYTRDGFDLYADLPVSASVVASGGEVVFETLRDTVKFRVPQGVENGQLLRLEQQGVPYLDASGVGDLLLRVQIT